MLVEGEILGAVVEQGGQAGLLPIGAQVFRQLHRRHLDAQHMPEAAGLQCISHGIGQRHELLVRIKCFLVDVPFHRLRHQAGDGPTSRQAIPYLGGGKLPYRGEEGNLGIKLLRDLLSRLRLAAVLPGPADADQMGLFADDLRVVPGGEGTEHIAANDEIQLIMGVLLLQVRQGEGRIAGAALVQFPVGSHESDFPFAGQLHHAVALLAVRSLGQLLMGRNTVNHEDDFIEAQCVTSAAGHIQVSVVDGVKAAT